MHQSSAKIRIVCLFIKRAPHGAAHCSHMHFTLYGPFIQGQCFRMSQLFQIMAQIRISRHEMQRYCRDEDTRRRAQDTRFRDDGIAIERWITKACLFMLHRRPPCEASAMGARNR